MKGSGSVRIETFLESQARQYRGNGLAQCKCIPYATRNYSKKLSHVICNLVLFCELKPLKFQKHSPPPSGKNYRPEKEKKEHNSAWTNVLTILSGDLVHTALLRMLHIC